MGWPDAQSYLEAIQNPAWCFEDPDLKRGVATPDELGLPRAWSGATADVYRVERADTGQAWAVKCFTREVQDLHARYAEIASHLRHVAQSRLFVDFAYLDRGIRVEGAWYPVVKMTWVDGVALNSCVASIAHEPERLMQLAALWPVVEAQLAASQVAHGDLQHGNVLLVRGTSGRLLLRLVDYDGVWVPALMFAKPGEVGHPNYQHPARSETEGAFGPTVDRFSLLVIHTALRALALEGRALWDQFNTGDNLLFTQADHADPAHSELIQSLWRRTGEAQHLPEPGDLRALLGHLVLALREPLARQPALGELLRDGQVQPLTAAQSRRVEAILAGEPAMVAAPVALPSPAPDLSAFVPRPPRVRRSSGSWGLIWYISIGLLAGVLLGGLVALVLQSALSGSGKG
jgi:hypothetical protein